MAKITRSIRLECTSGKHNKYYCIFELDDGRIESHYGRIGTKPQRKIYRPGDAKYTSFTYLQSKKTSRFRKTGSYHVVEVSVKPKVNLLANEHDIFESIEIPALTNIFDSDQIDAYVAAISQFGELT